MTGLNHFKPVCLLVAIRQQMLHSASRNLYISMWTLPTALNFCEHSLYCFNIDVNRINGPFVYGGTNCTRGWNFADIFFPDSVKIMRFYDFARTSVS